MADAGKAFTQKIMWAPQPRQEEALSRTEFEVGFGGARGGGKTDAGQAWMLYDHEHPKYRGLVIRKNSTDLFDWRLRARQFFSGTGARFVSNTIRFPKGGVILLGHLKDQGAYEKYMGHEYQRMLLEELTQIPSEDSYLKLISSCRSTVPELRPQVFSTFNPGGPGHGWVKRRFRLVGTPTDTIAFEDPITGRGRAFVPSRVDDNPYLMQNDPDYVAFLDGLPDGLREQWRYGSWDDPDVKGAIFGNELRWLQKNHRLTKVVFDPQYKVYTFWDLGIDDFTFIILAQFIGNTICIPLVIQDSGYGLLHYTKKLKEIATEKKLTYGKHWFPHDIRVREYTDGEVPRQRLEVAEKQLGSEHVEVVKQIPKEDQINAGRIIASRLYIDEVGGEPLVNALRNHRLRWNEEQQNYKDLIHDWASHGADAYMGLSVAYEGITGDRLAKSVSEFEQRVDTRIGLVSPEYAGGEEEASAVAFNPFHIN